MQSAQKRVIQTTRGIQAIIDQGQPGARLPSELDLASQLSVSRATVRDALVRLWLKGKVTRRWGAGTFISTRRSENSDAYRAIYLDLEEVGAIQTLLTDGGKTPGVSYFEQSVLPAPAWVAAEFGIAEGSEVRHIVRCITADGAPAMVLRDYVPLLVNGAPLQLEGFASFENDFPSAFRALGMRLVKQVANLDARLADAELSTLLGVGVGEPLIYAEQFSHAESGETVICTEGFYVSSVYRTVLVRTLAN